MQRSLTSLLILVSLLIFGLLLIAQKKANPAMGHTLTEATDMENTPAANAGGGARQQTPVIVELFTSEGCSSCPPADDVLARLEKSQPVPGVEIIALGQHVDYWNYLGWSDPFSAPAFSQRQGDYARAFARDGVYTPQMVVDGRAEFPGGNGGKASEAIASASRNPKAVVKLEFAGEKQDARSESTAQLKVRIEKLPAVSAGNTVEVLLALTESDLRTAVPRGENGGRTLSHAPVVRQLSVIGTANGEAAVAYEGQQVLTISRAWKRQNVRAVVFVQERATRRVLGAASIKLGGA